MAHLINHWKLNDNEPDTNVIDVFGSDGTSQRNTEDISMDGKIGKALNFNGTSDYILLPDIDSEITDSVSVAMWIYPRSAEGGYQGLAGNETAQGFFTFIKQNQFYFDIENTENVRVFEGKGNIINNQWQHLVATYDGAEMNWYINGDSVGAEEQSGDVKNFPSGHIGWSGYSTEYFNGLIDDVRFYIGGLSAAEVSSLYFDSTPKGSELSNQGEFMRSKVGRLIAPTNQIVRALA